MNTASANTPLVLLIQLTADQRRQVLEQTGQNVTVFPYETDAPAVRFNFGGVELRVTRGVFLPTTGSAQLLRSVLTAVAGRDDPVIIEAGTGCGAIALACATALPKAEILATDTSEAALRCARQNRARLGSRNVRFLKGSLLSRIPVRLRGQANLIVGNLPYLPPHFATHAALSFPPDTAIGTDSDGLGLPRILASQARAWLQPGGSLVLQLAGFQWPDFSSELIELGYDQPVLSSAAPDVPVAGNCIWAGQG